MIQDCLDASGLARCRDEDMTQNNLSPMSRRLLLGFSRVDVQRTGQAERRASLDAEAVNEARLKRDGVTTQQQKNWIVAQLDRRTSAARFTQLGSLDGPLGWVKRTSSIPNRMKAEDTLYRPESRSLDKAAQGRAQHLSAWKARGRPMTPDQVNPQVESVLAHHLEKYACSPLHASPGTMRIGTADALEGVRLSSNIDGVRLSSTLSEGVRRSSERRSSGDDLPESQQSFSSAGTESILENDEPRVMDPEFERRT